jgi:hypothetical protein
MEPKDRTLLGRPLRRRRLVDRVRVDQEREQRTVDPTGRLDHERVVPRLLLLIEVREVLAARGLVRLQVVVGAVRDPLELGPVGPGVRVLDVDRALRVVAELVGVVLAQAQVLGLDPEVEVPAVARLDPVVVPLLVGPGLDEELHLHLLELAHPEDEVPGVISLRNDLPIWAIPNGIFLRDAVWICAKSTNGACAVSGRRYTWLSSSGTGPMCVENMRLKLCGSVKPLLPQFGQTGGSGRWSCRKRW